MSANINPGDQKVAIVQRESDVTALIDEQQICPLLWRQELWIKWQVLP